ncbi:MAG: 50S ribosomal protein L17 [Candidatus Sungbacteria bacterium]|uniref:Large ribosomal subunit protein bL17 n=1 Tax=Candidatus Sungiibacteriota bacterium TaxID=2750080 RepID=A0A931WN56_9BACT|nr:50S ribosomal protein L17 [Candidatus Sungbacteria bacterium]
MQHKRRGRKFGRTRDQRKAFIKSLISALVLKKRIQTTEARAKEIRPKVERLVTKAKAVSRGETKRALHNRREIMASTSPKIAKILIDDIAPKYHDRHGGYTRIMKTGVRRSDGARLAIIEFV